MDDIELILDTAQAMEAIGRTERAKHLRAAAIRLSRKPVVPKLHVIDGLPADVVMLVAGNTVKFVQDDG